MTRLARFYVCATALLLACALAPAFAAEAATRFVATTGSDAGPNTCLASGSPCKTITYALITQAVANDTISVAAGTYNPALGETFPLVIAVNLTLTGAGAPGTIIDAGGTNQVVQNNFATVTISGVTITGGDFAQGGGLSNAGTLTLTNSTVSGNTASCAATQLSCFAQGGGIYNNAGTLTLTNSTVSGNTASCTSISSCFAQGGGIYNNAGTPTLITNSTVSGNTASCSASGSGNGCRAEGGGLYLNSATTLANSTVTANTASCTTSAGASCSTGGGGTFSDGEGTSVLSLGATIVALQLAGADCDGDASTSNGFNLDSDTTCGLSGTGDQSGVVNPLLGPLQNNGGPTNTHALLTGSPAIDAVTSGCPPPATDQRGITRPQGPACDIGAYEVQTAAAGIPTLSEWAQIGMAALLVGGGLLALRRNRQLS